MPEINVNGSVLEWARVESHLSLESAAHDLKIAVVDLERYEKGKLKPNLTLLKKMASVYGLPLATLAMPRKIDGVKLPRDYRTIEGKPENISHLTALAIRRARRYASAMKEIELDAPRLVRRKLSKNITLSSNAKEVAEQQRKLFDVSIDQQLKWRNPRDAFKKWRDEIETKGIYVHILDYPYDDCKGFSLEDEGILVIVISKDDPSDGSKIFTMFHEYCHHLLGKPGMSSFSNRVKTERFCNEFAANFLMPFELVKKVLPLPEKKEPIDWEPAYIKGAANKLKVSQQALALQLELSGYAPKGYFDNYKSQQEKIPQKKKQTKGPKKADSVLREVGDRYAYNVLYSYDRGNIHEVDAYRMLDAAPAHFDLIRQRLANRKLKYDQPDWSSAR